jgi:hypothetical protein
MRESANKTNRSTTDHLINPQATIRQQYRLALVTFPAFLSPHQVHMHNMLAHLLGCYILASARTPPVALNTFGFDWLLLICGKTCVLVEFTSRTGDSGLGVRGSLSPVVLLFGLWVSDELRIVWGTLVLRLRRLMGWRLLWRVFFWFGIVRRGGGFALEFDRVPVLF